MRSIITGIRFCLVLVSVTLMAVAVLLISPFAPNFVHQQLRIIWTTSLLLACGAKLNISGCNLLKPKLANSMLVSNHISWLDTVVMLRLCFVQYIGKIEMQRWPILNRIIKAGGTIFINRHRKRDILNVNTKVAQLLSNGATIGLYPEGTTSAGHQVQAFKAPLLEAALLADSIIYPIVINYCKHGNQRAQEVSFAKVNWLTTVINTLHLNGLRINVVVLPPIKATNFSNREQLSAYLHQQISQCYQRQLEDLAVID